MYKIQIMKKFLKYTYLKPVPLKINTLASNRLILNSFTNQSEHSFSTMADDQLAAL